MNLQMTHPNSIADGDHDEPKILIDREKQSLYKKPVYIENNPMRRIKYRPPNIISQIYINTRSKSLFQVSSWLFFNFIDGNTTFWSQLAYMVLALISTKSKR